MSANRVLVVEDDRTLLEVLRYNLSNEGYEVIVATDGAEALELARAQKPDLIILDIMLPKLDGFDVCRILRSETNIPIVMLTAKTEEVDRVVGLELGADDYIIKPFSMRELLARAKAVVRRSTLAREEAESPAVEPASGLVTIGELQIDIDRRRVYLAGVDLEVSPKEFELLHYLIANRGRVFDREHLLERVWGYNYVGDPRTVDVHVRWLRQKIEADPSHPRHLVTVRGVGYKYED